MMDERDIKKSVQYTAGWLADKQKKHVAMVEKSIINLQNDIIDTIQRLELSKTGKIEGLKVNMKQAQKIHADVNKMFDKHFSADTKKIVDDFKSVSTTIKKSYGMLDEAVKFTAMDEKTMDVLRDGYWREYLAIGDQQKNKIIQSVYDQAIANRGFSSLVNTISGALMGSGAVDVVGRSLAQYSRLYARDMIMNFHNEVNVQKSKDIGLKHFLYVGDIIKTTRPFCKSRAGKTYTEDQINSWDYSWIGKSGPAMTNRGGYNCRHHWQGVKPEWLEGKKKLDVADWFEGKEE